jgi:glycosyltransferase involved in cell wall biosynthesis
MPCLLKAPTEQSPGVITLTNNELLNGIVAQSQRVRDHIASTANREWIYGAHIQGNVSSLGRWKLEPWQSFVMWPDEEDPVFTQLPDGVLFPRNCINFLPDPAPALEREFDLCVVSRPSPLKRPTSSLLIIKRLLELDPTLRFVVIAHDPRDLSLGERAYARQAVERSFFELPLKLFTATELNQIAFIASSTQAFGMFPLSAALVVSLIARSRLLLLTSHHEGTPRVVGEALMAGTPCVVSENLSSGLNRFLTDRNSLRIPDEEPAAAAQIAGALASAELFSIDRTAMWKQFSASANVPWLRERLRDLAGTDSDLYLDDLHLRLACHGQKRHCQLMTDDPGMWFEWLERVQRYGPYDEDNVVLPLGLPDAYRHTRRSKRQIGSAMRVRLGAALGR